MSNPGSVTRSRAQIGTLEPLQLQIRNLGPEVARKRPNGQSLINAASTHPELSAGERRLAIWGQKWPGSARMENPDSMPRVRVWIGNLEPPQIQARNLVSEMARKRPTEQSRLDVASARLDLPFGVAANADSQSGAGMTLVRTHGQPHLNASFASPD